MSNIEQILTRYESGLTLQASNPLQQQVLNFISTWVNTTTYGLPTIGTLAFFVEGALQKMFHAGTGFPDNQDLFTQVMANPGNALWGHCGNASVFMRKALAAFDIESHYITPMQSGVDDHILVEYIDPASGRPIYLDPLYGAVYVRGDGTLAAFSDLLGEMQQHGYSEVAQNTSWDWQCLDLGVEFGVQGDAVDPLFRTYEENTYQHVMETYWSAVADRLSDTTLDGTPLPGELRTAGNWLVYINGSNNGQDIGDYARGVFAHYDADGAGNYRIAPMIAGTALSAGVAGSVLQEHPNPTNAVFAENWAPSAATFFDAWGPGTSAVTPATANQTALIAWIKNQIGVTNAAITKEALPLLVAASMREMFLDAPAKGASWSALYGQMVWNPTGASGWLDGGNASPLFKQIMTVFGVECQQIAGWSSINSAASFVEFYSEQYHKFVLYDPMQGVFFVNSAGAPAGLDDLLVNVNQFGLGNGERVDLWDYQPLRINGNTPTDTNTAADPAYQAIVSANYDATVGSFMGVVARMDADSGLQQTWTVYDNSAFVASSSRYGASFWSTFESRYEISGRDVSYFHNAEAPYTPTPATDETNDFNGDGQGDLLWVGPSSLGLWEMTETGKVGVVMPFTTPGAPWDITGVGDFDGDDDPDLVLQNSSTGEFSVWTLEGLSRVGGDTSGVMGLGREIVSIKDINGDGFDDVFTFNPVTRDAELWSMHGPYAEDFDKVGTLPTGWNIVDVGDFNGDGRHEALMYHAGGAVSIWWVGDRGGQVVTNVGNSGTIWKPVAAGDINGDGSDDVILRAANSSSVAAWLIDDGIRTMGMSIGNVALSWSVESALDFTADGRDDLLWRDASGHLLRTDIAGAGSPAIDDQSHFYNPGSQWDLLL